MVLSLSVSLLFFPTTFGVRRFPTRQVYWFGITSAFSAPQAAAGATAHGNVGSNTDASSVK